MLRPRLLHRLLLDRRTRIRLTVLIRARRVVAVIFEVIARLDIRPLIRLLRLIGIVLLVLRRELRLRCRDHPKIVFGMLQISFGRDRVAGRLRIASKLKIFFGDMVGGASDLHVRPV
jgi:hypothetical protein